MIPFRRHNFKLALLNTPFRLDLSRNGKSILLHFLFCKQLGSGLSPQSCLYSQSFWDSKLLNGCLIQKQPFRGVLGKRCSEKMQQIYRRTPMLK